MRKIKIINSLFCLAVSISSVAQNLDEVFNSVLLNNKSIQANNKYLDKLNVEAKTGLTLKNPTISFLHLWDQNDASGFAEEFEASQSFDFPSSYAYKNAISTLEIQKTEDHRKLFSLDILLDAKNTCTEIIYLRKKDAELIKRADYASSLVNNIRSKLQNGYATQFELDKALISEMAVQNEKTKIENTLKQKEDHLTELNGGQEIHLQVTEYPEEPVPESLTTLFEHIEAIDPVNQLINLEIKIAEQNIKLTRTGSLPEFELGYKSERGIMDKLAGITMGMSIPLWQNKHKVQGSIVNMEQMKGNITNHENEHYFATKALYDDFSSTSEQLTKFRDLWNRLNYLENVEKALKQGEISTTEYFIELKSLYELKDNLLDIEKDYQLVLNRLNKYDLLKYL